MPWASTLKMNNDRSPDVGMWMATVLLKSSGKYAGKSGKQTVLLSPLSHLSTQTAKKKKAVFKDGRKQWKSQAHSLHLFPAYHRLTHLTHLIQSDIYKKCPAVNQTVRMPIKFTAFFVG